MNANDMDTNEPSANEPSANGTADSNATKGSVSEHAPDERYAEVMPERMKRIYDKDGLRYVRMGESMEIAFESLKDLSGLARRLSNVLGQVGYVKKSGVNDYHGYTYVTETDLTEAIRPALDNQDISILTSIADSREIKQGGDKITAVTTEHLIM